LFKKRRWSTWKEDKRRTIEDGKKKKKWKIAAMPSNKKVLGVFDSVISRKKKAQKPKPK